MYIKVLLLLLCNKISGVFGTCGEFFPSIFSNGAVRRSYSNGYEIGSVVTFSCDLFWQLSGATQAVCENGLWLLNPNEQPMCGKGECVSINPPIDGGMSCTVGIKSGSVCYFNCNAGYEMVGITWAQCMTDLQWTSPVPSCREKTCPLLGPPTDGNVSCTKNEDAGSICSFRCNPGFEINGQVQTTCNTNFQWTFPAPTCQVQIITCQILDPVENGNVTCSNSNHQDSVCSYRCNKGYMIHGRSTIICRGKWSDDFSYCKRIVCTDTGTVDKGLVNCSDSNYYNSLCKITCDKGYLLNGPKEITCDINGHWSEALPICTEVKKQCQTIAGLENGMFSCTKNSEINSVCVFNCISNYMLVGVSAISCSANMKWNFSLPTCEESLCEPPLSILYEDSVSCTNSNKLDSVCNIMCPQSERAEEHVCLLSSESNSGLWNLSSTACPTGLANVSSKNLACDRIFMDVMILINGSHPVPEYNISVKFVTLLLDNLFPLAVSDHVWLRVAETNKKMCDDISSNIVAKPFEENLFGTANNRVVDNILHVADCPSSSHYLKALYDFIVHTGRQVAKPVLVYIVFGNLAYHEIIESTILTELGASIFVVCLSSNEANYLQTNFNFYSSGIEDMQPTAHKVTQEINTYFCPGPRCNHQQQLTHGNAVCTFIPMLGSFCEFHCDSNFVLEGNALLKCIQNDGNANEWDIEPPTCTRKMCTQIYNRSDLTIVCSNANNFLSECLFFCEKGSFLVGSLSVICHKNSNNTLYWSDSIPVCETDLLCQPPLVEPTNGLLSCPNGNNYNAECAVSCKDGYLLQGNKTIKCNLPQADGLALWSSPMPTCQACDPCKQDILVVLDISGLTTNEDFTENLNFVFLLLQQNIGAIEEGDILIGIVQIGGNPNVVCSSGNVEDVFQIELELSSYNMNFIKFVVDNIQHTGGCSASKQTLLHSVTYITSVGRPKSSTEKKIILVTNTKPFTSSEQVSEFIQQYDIELSVVNIGDSYQRSLEVLGKSQTESFDKSLLFDPIVIEELYTTDHGSAIYDESMLRLIMLFITFSGTKLTIR